jgi:hypothetical protein
MKQANPPSSSLTQVASRKKFLGAKKAGRIFSLTIVVSLISSRLMMLVCLAMAPWLTGGSHSKNNQLPEE